VHEWRQSQTPVLIPQRVMNPRNKKRNSIFLEKGLTFHMIMIIIIMIDYE